MSDFSQDLRFALRSLAKNPVVTLAVVAALALGIGANTVMFSVVDTLLLRGVPGVADQDALTAVFSTRPSRDGGAPKPGEVSHADYLDFAGASSFSSVAAFNEVELSLTHDGPSERLDAQAVSDNYFTVLGVRPARGRLFAASTGGAANVDGAGGEVAGEAVAVISHSLWQRRFGGDASLLGRTVHLNGKPVTVVGVAPQGFHGTSKTTDSDIWLTLDTFRSIAVGIYAKFYGAEDRKQTWLELVGRRAPGVTLAEARGELEVIAARLAEAYPETNEGRGVEVLPLSEVALGTGNREKIVRYSGLLLGLVAVVLLVACLDVAALLLARALARRREIAIRLALGAGRGRLIRQLLTESLTLALIGGASGLALAALALPVVERLRLPIEMRLELALDARVAGFTIAASLLCGLPGRPGACAALGAYRAGAGAARRVVAAGVQVAPVRPRRSLGVGAGGIGACGAGRLGADGADAQGARWGRPRLPAGEHAGGVTRPGFRRLPGRSCHRFLRRAQRAAEAPARCTLGEYGVGSADGRRRHDGGSGRQGRRGAATRRR